ncbi:MAG: hypothetical protein TR69_WS6001001125 [candidate division WS6 bacterium OLB20]|uniref:Uncharacterized protein n=1 Tax=candidate division WS6 bacterium OLB20 TaxID=1617426 RepID=A0A136LZM1_9BACT|nr:MAG: hypothetical protein TR69_WS6001001125 [candidate division WS6 bacterium OLB20]
MQKSNNGLKAIAFSLAVLNMLLLSFVVLQLNSRDTRQAPEVAAEQTQAVSSATSPVPSDTPRVERTRQPRAQKKSILTSVYTDKSERNAPRISFSYPENLKEIENLLVVLIASGSETEFDAATFYQPRRDDPALADFDADTDFSYLAYIYSPGIGQTDTEAASEGCISNSSEPAPFDPLAASLFSGEIYVCRTGETAEIEGFTADYTYTVYLGDDRYLTAGAHENRHPASLDLFRKIIASVKVE